MESPSGQSHLAHSDLHSNHVLVVLTGPNTSSLPDSALTKIILKPKDSLGKGCSSWVYFSLYDWKATVTHSFSKATCVPFKNLYARLALLRKIYSRLWKKKSSTLRLSGLWDQVNYPRKRSWTSKNSSIDQIKQLIDHRGSVRQNRFVDKFSNAIFFGIFIKSVQSSNGVDQKLGLNLLDRYLEAQRRYPNLINDCQNIDCLQIPR